MKSNAIAAFLTMLLVVLYPLVDSIQTDGFRDMARFIPDNTLIYLEQRNGAKALKDFSKSSLGKTFESINFVETCKKIGLTDTVLTLLQDTLSFYTLAKRSKLVHEVFGKRFAVAVLAPADKKKYRDINDYINDNMVIVAKPEHSAGGLQFLGESYAKYVDAYSVSSAQYGNHHIKRMQISGEILSIVVIEGSFVMSRNEKLLRRCIDTFDGELPSLAKNTDFGTIRKKFAMPDRFFYAPINNLRTLVIETVADLTFSSKDLLLKELSTTIGFANFGYGSWNSKKKVTDKILVQYNSKEVNNIVKNHIETAPSRCSMLSLTTENPMAFYWSNTLKVKHFLRYFEKSRKEEPQIEKFWSTIENISGHTPKEIFSLFGEEVSLVLEPGPKDQFFSFPLGMCFVQVRDVQKLRTILEKIIDEYDIQVSESSSGPVRYSYWTRSPQDGLQPLYGFWGDLMFFGNSSRLLGLIVDKNSENFTLLNNGSVKAIDPGLTEKNNSITYLNNFELFKVLQKGLDFVAITLAIEDRETAFKLRTVIDEIINPLLNGARMYEKSCTRSYFTPQMVVIDSVTNKSTALIKKRIK